MYTVQDNFSELLVTPIYARYKKGFFFTKLTRSILITKGARSYKWVGEQAAVQTQGVSLTIVPSLLRRRALTLSVCPFSFIDRSHVRGSHTLNNCSRAIGIHTHAVVYSIFLTLHLIK